MARSSFKWRPLAATYLCRFAAKARFDNRLTQGERFPKGRGRNPSPFGRFKERGFLRGEGNRNPSPLKPFFGYFLSGKKVPRRRQGRKQIAAALAAILIFKQTLVGQVLCALTCLQTLVYTGCFWYYNRKY